MVNGLDPRLRPPMGVEGKHSGTGEEIEILREIVFGRAGGRRKCAAGECARLVLALGVTDLSRSFGEWGSWQRD
jgi:hypothetical protein